MANNTNYYNNVSRYYKNVNIATISAGPTAKLLDIPLLTDNIKFSANDIQFYYTVNENEAGRLDIIAFKVYGNSKLWWPIAVANQLEDILVEPVAGSRLKIPSPASIQKWL